MSDKYYVSSHEYGDHKPGMIIYKDGRNSQIVIDFCSKKWIGSITNSQAKAICDLLNNWEDK